jgi:hypothetical protein
LNTEAQRVGEMDWESTVEEPLDNGEGPSGTSPFHVDRKNSAYSNETSSSEEMPIASIARSARVIRRIFPMGNYDGSADIPRVRMTMVERCLVDNYTGYSTYEEQFVAPTPFDGQETTMDKGKGKAPMRCDGHVPGDMATAAPDQDKGKGVETVGSLTEAMGTLVVGESKRPAVTPLQRIDWSRLTRPEFVSWPGSENSIGTLIQLPSWV